MAWVVMGGGQNNRQDDSMDQEEDFKLINERKEKRQKGQVEIESETANFGSWKVDHSLVLICVSVCWCVCEYEMKNTSLWGIGKLDSEFILKTSK